MLNYWMDNMNMCLCDLILVRYIKLYCYIYWLIILYVYYIEIEFKYI